MESVHLVAGYNNVGNMVTKSGFLVMFNLLSLTGGKQSKVNNLGGFRSAAIEGPKNAKHEREDVISTAFDDLYYGGGYTVERGRYKATELLFYLEQTVQYNLI